MTVDITHDCIWILNADKHLCILQSKHLQCRWRLFRRLWYIHYCSPSQASGGTLFLLVKNKENRIGPLTTNALLNVWMRHIHNRISISYVNQWINIKVESISEGKFLTSSSIFRTKWHEDEGPAAWDHIWNLKGPHYPWGQNRRSWCQGWPWGQFKY